MRRSHDVVPIDLSGELRPLEFAAADAPPEPTLFDWMRQYAALVVLMTVIGLAAGIVYDRLVPGGHEAWVILVEDTGQIQPRSLGPSAQAIFRSRPVWGPVMKALDVPGSPASFLEDSAELRPVPDTPVLIVVGRDEDPERASAIAEGMARSLEAAFRDTGIAGFEIFSNPQAVPVSTGFADPPLLAAGAALWIGIALALIHYRVRRPVLSMASALAVSGADDVLTVRGAGARWLGMLRPISDRPRRWDRDGHRAVVASLTPGDVVFVPGLSRRREGRAREQLLSVSVSGERAGRARGGPGADAARRAVFVCSPSTPTRDLGEAALIAQTYDRPSLVVWVE